MRTFGRVVAGLGVGLALIGGAGAIATLPPAVLEDASSYIEQHRQALREHLPEMPNLQELIVGLPEDDCANGALGNVSVATEGCAGKDDQAVTVTVLPTRSGGGSAGRFRAPAPESEKQ